MESGILEWIKVIGSLVLSWPVVILVIVLTFRKRLLYVFDRFIGSDEGSKIEVASVKIELGKLAREGKDAVTNLNRLTILMAESRLLGLEITEGIFGNVFSQEQRERMSLQLHGFFQASLLTAENRGVSVRMHPSKNEAGRLVR